jgi:FkbM family methyltransferase
MQETWRERTVLLPDGRTHAMLVDTAQTDATTEMYLKGDGIWVNRHLVALMFALTQPGDRVLDLGGFVGEIALAAATHGCRVVSVEANADQAHMLATSAELNHFDDLQVVHAAVGDRTGTVDFLGRGPYGQVAQADDVIDVAGHERVTQLTVDDLVAALEWGGVDFLKIDVEGSEASALQGASRLLSRPDAPALLFESNTFVLRDLASDPGALLRQVEAVGYTLYRVAPDGIWPWDAFQLQPEVVVDFLALKGRTPADAGLVVNAPLSADDSAAIVAGQVEMDSFDHSIAMAWQLQFAPPELLAHRVVKEAVASLQNNSDDRVRAEAARIGHPRPEPAAAPVTSVRLHEEFDGAWAAERALRRTAETRLAILAGLTARERAEPQTPGPLDPAAQPGPLAMALARRLSDTADRHPRLAGMARRVIRPGS